MNVRHRKEIVPICAANNPVNAPSVLRVTVESNPVPVMANVPFKAAHATVVGPVCAQMLPPAKDRKVVG